MALEIERKFLLSSDAWRSQITQSTLYRQGYLTPSVQDAKASVRVRVEGKRGVLNVKSVRMGIQRHEYEYEIPLADANEMLDTLCGAIIEKTRHLVPLGTHVCEIDEFHGDNAGLIVAEVELAHVDEAFARPAWLGLEVTEDARYYNVALVSKPYSTWSHPLAAPEWDEREY
ncbi:MAG: CYTH domain-containing protein [Halothiobacillaceae bacterium]|nr:CYTH domain-containing protein [Halothiobacillaceae bacterium]